MSRKRLKLLGLGCLLPSIIFLGIFIFGEFSLAQPMDSLSHVIQLAPLLLVAWFAWKKPQWGGLLLSGFSVLLAILYVLKGNQSMETNILVLLVLFLPPFLSGISFILSTKKSE